MGPNEPFWRTNSSFSPPPFSTHWDFEVQSEEQPYESDVHTLTTLYDLSLSPNSRESESWVINGEQNRVSPSDDSFSYMDSPDSFQNQQLMPPLVQGVYMNDYVRDPLPTHKTSRSFTEGPLVSDDSEEYELTSKLQASSHRSFTSCCSFMTKPVHPEYDNETEDNTPYSYATSSYVSNPNIFGGSKCGLCSKFLFQKSPFGACKLIYSGDMPVSSILSCCHVYHAECLERITPKTQKLDPPCPICQKFENNNYNNVGVENWAISRMKSGLPSLRSLGEEGTSKSRVWSCGQKGDFVEGASMDVSRSSRVLLRNRSRMKRQLSLKGDNARKSVVCSPQLSIGEVGCSNTAVN